MRRGFFLGPVPASDVRAGCNDHPTLPGGCGKVARFAKINSIAGIPAEGVVDKRGDKADAWIVGSARAPSSDDSPALCGGAAEYMAALRKIQARKLAQTMPDLSGDFIADLLVDRQTPVHYAPESIDVEAQEVPAEPCEPPPTYVVTELPLATARSFRDLAFVVPAFDIEGKYLVRGYLATNIGDAVYADFVVGANGGSTSVTLDSCPYCGAVGDVGFGSRCQCPEMIGVPGFGGTSTRYIFGALAHDDQVSDNFKDIGGARSANRRYSVAFEDHIHIDWHPPPVPIDAAAVASLARDDASIRWRNISAAWVNETGDAALDAIATYCRREALVDFEFVALEGSCRVICYSQELRRQAVCNGAISDAVCARAAAGVLDLWIRDSGRGLAALRYYVPPDLVEHLDITDDNPSAISRPDALTADWISRNIDRALNADMTMANFGPFGYSALRFIAIPPTFRGLDDEARCALANRLIAYHDHEYRCKARCLGHDAAILYKALSGSATLLEHLIAPGDFSSAVIMDAIRAKRVRMQGSKAAIRLMLARAFSLKIKGKDVYAVAHPGPGRGYGFDGVLWCGQSKNLNAIFDNLARGIRIEIGRDLEVYHLAAMTTMIDRTAYTPTGVIFAGGGVVVDQLPPDILVERDAAIKARVNRSGKARSKGRRRRGRGRVGR